MKTILLLLTIGLAFGMENQPEVTQTAIDMALEAHNQCRQNTDANPKLKDLTWDEDLATFAKTVADRIGKTRCGTSPLSANDHSSNEERQGIEGFKQCGENLAKNHGQTVGELFKNSINSWCDEKKNYDIATDVSTGVTGHYKQVCSQNTAKVGCAMVACETTGHFGYSGFVVCIYGEMKSNGRPYLLADSFDCSKLEDKPNQKCAMWKRSGACETNTYANTVVCIKTCNGCKRIGIGVEQSQTGAEPISNNDLQIDDNIASDPVQSGTDVNAPEEEKEEVIAPEPSSPEDANVIGVDSIGKIKTETKETKPMTTQEKPEEVPQPQVVEVRTEKKKLTRAERTRERKEKIRKLKEQRKQKRIEERKAERMRKQTELEQAAKLENPESSGADDVAASCVPSEVREKGANGAEILKETTCQKRTVLMCMGDMQVFNVECQKTSTYEIDGNGEKQLMGEPEATCAN